MALFKYFKRTDDKASSILPDPQGSLSAIVPSSRIEAVNTMVRPVIEEQIDDNCSKKSSRGKYEIFSPDEKAKIGKRAAEHGVLSTIRHFSKIYPDCALNESTVRGWKNKYKNELWRLKKSGEEVVVRELVDRKHGRPLLLGNELDQQVQAYVHALHLNGGIVNTAIVIATGEGIIKDHDSNLLCENGGHIKLTKDWAKYLLQRMNFVKRSKTSTAKVSVENFDQLKAQFLFDIKSIVEIEEIPQYLIINWDQTAIKYVPVSSWTMDSEGSKRVQIIGADDKRQITAVFGVTLSGDFMYPQLIYQGTTSKCLPSVHFPPDWHVTFTENHWSNENTMEDYLDKILLPYIDRKRSENKLDKTHPALVIYDTFRGQCTQKILDKLETNSVHVTIVPANCTDRLQPLDLSVNKAAKEFLRKQFSGWYSDQIYYQLRRGVKPIQSIDLRLSMVKPLGARWVISLFDYFKAKPDIIKNGFKEAGITFTV